MLKILILLCTFIFLSAVFEIRIISNVGYRLELGEIQIFDNTTQLNIPVNDRSINPDADSTGLLDFCFDGKI
jgi:hypothetical protein